jgi:hypothetical protein
MRCTSEQVGAARGPKNGDIRRLLPIKDGGEEFGYESFVVWTESLAVDGLVALAV